MKKLVPLALGLALVAGLLSGCGKTSPSEPLNQSATPTAEDVAQVNEAVAANGDYVEEDVFESNEPAQLDPADPGMAAIRPLFWWRTIHSVTRRFETQFMNPDSAGRPTLALVTVHKRLLGSFNILAGDSAAHADSLLRKRLDDRWERRLVLQRVRVSDSNGDAVRSMWRLAGTSGVQVTSNGATTRIRGVRIQAGLLDTTITDPLELHRLRRVLHIPAGTEVNVTVTTGDASDIVLLYRWHHRARFHNNGNGSFAFRWTTGSEGGLRHFGVNALSRGTLFDDAASYDSQAWMFPFVVNRADDKLDG